VLLLFLLLFLPALFKEPSKGLDLGTGNLRASRMMIAWREMEHLTGLFAILFFPGASGFLEVFELLLFVDLSDELSGLFLQHFFEYIFG
jgi:hypothetical protein